MALVVADRVQETTTTTGTGTITLAGAVAGFQSFAAIGDGNTTYYCITSGTAWEVGVGTYTAAGTTLARTTILASSASGAAITLAGTSNVFCVYPAGKSVNSDGIDGVPIGVNSQSTGAFTTLAVGPVSTGSSPITTINATDITAASAASLQCRGYKLLSSDPGFTLEIGRSRGTTVGQLVSVASSTGLGRILWTGYTNTWNVAAAITATAGTVGTGTLGGTLNLATTSSGGTTATNRLSISQSGQVLIGDNAETNGPALGATQAAKLSASSATYTDGATAASGTVTQGPINLFQSAILDATNTGVTYTNAATVYIAGAPTNGANVTITNPYALQIGTGNVNLGTGAVTAGSLSLTTALPFASGGTGKTTAPAAQAALMGFTTTATAGGTTALTNTSSVYQIFTGSSAQTITLPSTATLAQGWFFHICNNSTGTLTIQTSTAVSLGTIPSGLTVMASCVDTTVNTAAAWETGYTDFSTITGTGGVVLSTSPTITDLMLAAGTTTAPPLQFTSGTNLTTAAAGAMEYNGEMLYFSPLASTRAIVPNTQATVLITAYTLTSQTAAQKLFNTSTNGAVTLDTGIYQFECFMRLSAMSATSGTFGFALGGTATKTESWWATAVKSATLSTSSATWGDIYCNAANTAIAAASTATAGVAFIRGLINVTAAGTLIPQVSLSVAAAASVDPFSYFCITKLDGGTANFTVGNWS